MPGINAAHVRLTPRVNRWTTGPHHANRTEGPVCPAAPRPAGWAARLRRPRRSVRGGHRGNGQRLRDRHRLPRGGGDSVRSDV